MDVSARPHFHKGASRWQHTPSRADCQQAYADKRRKSKAKREFSLGRPTRSQERWLPVCDRQRVIAIQCTNVNRSLKVAGGWRPLDAVRLQLHELELQREAEDKDHGREKSGARFGFAGDWGYASGAVEEDCDGGDG